MISVFMRYLRAMDVDEKRIKVRMMIHLQDNEAQCREYWKTVTSLKDSNFISTIVKRAGPVKRPLPHGTVTIRYNSVELLRRVKSDISDLADRIS